jgi:hypothetical protein
VGEAPPSVLSVIQPEPPFDEGFICVAYEKPAVVAIADVNRKVAIIGIERKPLSFAMVNVMSRSSPADSSTSAVNAKSTHSAAARTRRAVCVRPRALGSRT